MKVAALLLLAVGFTDALMTTLVHFAPPHASQRRAAVLQLASSSRAEDKLLDSISGDVEAFAKRQQARIEAKVRAEQAAQAQGSNTLALVGLAAAALAGGRAWLIGNRLQAELEVI